MDTTILVNNKTKKTVILYSHDGDDIHIPGNAQKLPIDAKFNWNMPSSVVLSKSDVVSSNEPLESKSNLEEAKKRAFARRNGNATEKKIVEVQTTQTDQSKQIGDEVPVENTTGTRLSSTIASNKTPVKGA